MNTDSEKLMQRRRLVYSALMPYLKEDRLLEALWLWEQKYSVTNTLELRKFVSEIVGDNGESELKSKLYKSLTKATYFPGEMTLLPDPYNAMQQYREKCNGAFKYISPFSDQITVPFSTIIFQRMMETLLKQTKRENAVTSQTIIRQLNQTVSRNELRGPQYEELTDWLANKTDKLRLLYPEKFMSALINNLYVFCCREFGPVLTDNMLAKSINDACEMEESKFFNPRRLL